LLRHDRAGRSMTISREGSTMDTFDGTVNAGRKGVAYDWQAVLAESESRHLDRDLLTLAPAASGQHAA